MAVTGGTRDFQNARGQALVDCTTTAQITITYSLLPRGVAAGLERGANGVAAPISLSSVLGHALSVLRHCC